MPRISDEEFARVLDDTQTLVRAAVAALGRPVSPVELIARDDVDTPAPTLRQRLKTAAERGLLARANGTYWPVGWTMRPPASG